MSEAQGRVGRWLRNKWHLDSLIAIGGMAAVYASTHRNGARAAIKMLHSQYTRNEQARRRFLAEGYAANKVGHRNAVLVLDDDTTEDGEVYLVMELLEGESLEGRLERVGVMGPMEVLELTDQLLEVLACAHPKGILHRDIKPANIYLTRDGAVKLLDFGLARVRELSAEAMDQSDGIVFGTVSYIAPEQARADNQHLDARSDMWSIAATMFRALTGETVHPSTGPIIDRLLAVARKPPRSIATVLPNLPRPVIELVDRALAFEPEDRWPSANVMRVVVQDVMAQLREEAEEAAAESGTEVEMPALFNNRRPSTQPPGRTKTDRDLPAVRPGGPGAIRPSLNDSQTTRPKTDPVALSARPRTLPSATPEAKADDLDVDALRERPEETRQRRSRTLLTREGRAELRRILDARRAAQGLPAEEPAPAHTAPSSPGDSGVGDIDVDFDDSLIEVTIDHTGHGRHGPIAEPLVDPVTPAPVRAEPLPPSGSVPADSSSRATGGYAAVPASRTTGSHPTLGAPPTTGSHTTVGGRPTTGGHATVAAPPTTGSHPTVGGTSRFDDTMRRPGGATKSSPQQSERALEESDRRATAPSQPVPEDRRARTSSASYPTLGGPSSRPFSPTTPPPSRPDEITRVGPAPVSGEIVDAPARGQASVSGELGSRASGEITRVGPPPAPPRPPTGETPRPSSPGLNDTIRPKTIPPVSPRKVAPARPTPVYEPARLASQDEITGEHPAARLPLAQDRVLVEAARAAAAEASRSETGEPAAPASTTPEPTRAAATPPARPPRATTAETPRPAAAEAPRPAAASEAAPEAPAPAGEPVAKFLPRAGLFMAPSSRAGSEPNKSATGRAADPLPQRGAPGGTSQFRPDTLLPRRASAPAEPASAATRPVTEPHRSASEPAASTANANAEKPVASASRSGAPDPARTASRPASRPNTAASNPATAARPGETAKPVVATPAQTSVTTARPASETTKPVAATPARTGVTTARPASETAKPVAPTPAQTGVTTARPGASEAVKPVAATPAQTGVTTARPGASEAAKPAATTPIQTGVTTARPAATTPAQASVTTVKPGASEPARSGTPGQATATTTRPGASESAGPVGVTTPRPGTPAAGRTTDPARPITEKPVAPAPEQPSAPAKPTTSDAPTATEPAKPTDAPAPAPRAAKSMFNPYPSLAGRPGDDTARPRGTELSGPKDSKATSGRTGPHPAAAPDPKASSPAEPAPPQQPAAQPTEAATPSRAPSKPGAAPVLPFSFLRPAAAPRSSEPAPERPPGEPTDPTRKKP